VPSDAFGNTRASFFNLKNTGTIKFDYGMQTVKFANVDEAEANFMFQKLRDKKYIK